MDLKALETKWRTALSSILDELTENEFRKLLFNLEKIPQGKKEGRPRGDMPSVIIQYYSTEISIALIDKLMKNLPRLDAAVQQPLRGIKDELKKLQEKSKGTKAAADSGAAPKKKKPAAAATSKQTNGSGAAPKKKKPAAGTKAASDSGAAPKKKKPAAGTKAAADSGAAPKKKKPAAEVSGGSGETQIMGRDSTPNPAWFLPKAKKLPVGAVEPQPKEPAGATLKPKDQSAAPLQIRKIKVITLLRTTKTNAHLQVQFEGCFLEVYGKTEVLSEGMGFQTVEEFNKGFFHMLPLTVTANMRGKRILEMRMI
ncbi:uncharacterized protein LOC117546331 isoform X9 [Gymnodraco acuticeps]|uniref:Uncharacterized protein LOC117546331 isoform X9 n=1 Tax=Gymnodraco acuticeps TaxID=8218 RepID=A0A6P8UKH9_GYMAC|nr:uncharacterized protein LOC117546331 isoform X9 [Gymnodraco acuticeps]